MNEKRRLDDGLPDVEKYQPRRWVYKNGLDPSLSSGIFIAAAYSDRQE
jgi:hypothetical protein